LHLAEEIEEPVIYSPDVTDLRVSSNSVCQARRRKAVMHFYFSIEGILVSSGKHAFSIQVP
jgi:hypothetical protein